ncbi:hypothetical protein BDW68DRAFT_179823 [Aspergillus falconensis]
MKLTTTHLVLAALAPQVLAFSDACTETWVYCGSTLTQYSGYTVAELRASIPSPTLGLTAFAAYSEPGDALFRCIDDVGGLELAEFCFEGCTKPPNGDVCAAEE